MRLSEDEADLVASEAESASRALAEPARTEAARVADLARSVSPEVPDELVGMLGRIALASLQGGRARRLYRAEGERVLTRLLLRTPAGEALQAEVDEVNAALRSLAGRRLDQVRVGMQRPGSFTLNLQSEGVAITLAFRPEGVAVESLST